MSISLIALVVANAVPLVGVLFLGWELYDIMRLYWFENVVFGLWNVVKMAVVVLMRARKSWDAEAVQGIFLIPFFSFHYGMFMFVHGVFIRTLFGPEGAFGLSLPLDNLQRLFWPVLALMVSHGISFFYNFLGKSEFERVSVHRQMFKPYPRMAVVHVTIIFAGFAIMSLQAPELALVFLVALKTIIDVVAHLREHAKAKAAD